MTLRGISALAIANVREGVLLREQGITSPVYLCSLPNPEEADAIVSYSITPFVSDSHICSLIATAAERQKREGPRAYHCRYRHGEDGMFR